MYRDRQTDLIFRYTYIQTCFYTCHDIIYTDLINTDSYRCIETDRQTDLIYKYMYIYTDMIFTYNIYRYHISDLIYTDRYRYIETDRQTDRQI